GQQRQRLQRGSVHDPEVLAELSWPLRRCRACPPLGTGGLRVLHPASTREPCLVRAARSLPRARRPRPCRPPGSARCALRRTSAALRQRSATCKAATATGLHQPRRRLACIRGAEQPEGLLPGDHYHADQSPGGCYISFSTNVLEKG